MKKFSVGEVTAELLKKMGIEVWFHDSTSSTNQIAKDDTLKTSSELKVYLTNHQSAGRGRGQNTWSDEGHKDALLSSWSFAFQKNPQPILAPLVGLALFKNLEKHFSGLALSLKAPNDILVGSEKLSGILIENILSAKGSRSVIGIGLNVFSSPSNLNATHLSAHTEVTEAQWQNFLKDLKSSLGQALKSAESENLSPEVCRELKNALNKNPSLKEQILEVGPRGSLIYKNTQTDWHQI